MLVNGLRIAQRIEIIKPVNPDSLCGLQSTSSNILTTTLEDSDDNPVIKDMSNANPKVHNVILAPLKMSHTNKVAKFRI